jgi:hypothetical protein
MLPGIPRQVTISPKFSNIIISGRITFFLNALTYFSMSIFIDLGWCSIIVYNNSCIKNLVFSSLSRADLIPELLSIRYLSRINNYLTVNSWSDVREKRGSFKIKFILSFNGEEFWKGNKRDLYQISCRLEGRYSQYSKKGLKSSFNSSAQPYILNWL